MELQLGLRYSIFHYLGQETVFSYEDGIPRNINTIVDTTTYEENEIIQSYDSWEPRVGLKFKLNETNIIKLSYNKTSQYIHLITNTITPMPYNMWKPSNGNIKPQTGHQFSFGYFTSFHNT